MARTQNMRVPRPTGSRFESIPRAEIPRSQFDLSSGLKTTFNAGELIPVFVDEVLPGDTWTVRMTGFARLTTPIVPVMDNLYLESFFFFVPYRLVWDNWQRFNGEQDDPGDSTDFVIPRATIGTIGPADSSMGLADYFGIPLGTNTENLVVSALPFRAYNLIWNEWFRDQNLQDSLPVPKGDGPDTKSNLGWFGTDKGVRRRGKRHDYFTSALPWPQKGPSVTLPLGQTAPIAAQANVGDVLGIDNAAGTEHVLRTIAGIDPEYPVSIAVGAPDANLYADLTAATAASINELRQAFQIQRLLERDARGGTRYTEVLRSHFGVTSPDQRLQRPEYLGGGRSMVNVAPIAQTSSTDATSPQANLAAVGIGVMTGGHGFAKSFTEHGVVIGLVSCRADLTYQQGLNRMWSRRTRFDFYWPALAHLGEQAVLNKEIFVSNTGVDEEVFGYQERYAEYRYRPSLVTGLMRSDAILSLDFWHLAQEFDGTPELGPDFIVEEPPMDRILAVPDQPHFLLDCLFTTKAARPMPTYSVPGLIDHF